MKETCILSLLGAAVLALAPQTGQSALLLYYDFEGATATNGSTIINRAGGTNGTLNFGTSGGTVSFLNGGTVSGGNLGQVLSLEPAEDANGNRQAPHIDTAFSAAGLSLTPATAYTAMAWVNFGSTTGDNMIFGQAQGPADQVLHLGSRGGNYISGHWADDISPDTGAKTSVSIPTGTGNWQHVAFTNDTTGTQRIYVNGSEIASGAVGTDGQLATAQLVLLGTSANSGSFRGQFDEVKIYNETLNAQQIQAASVIPEPSAMALLGLASVGVGLLRRRRR